MASPITKSTVLSPMPSSEHDRIGRTFNRLTVVERARCPKQYAAETYILQAWYNCRCSCGVMTIKPWYHVRIGRVKSCGCLRRERATQNIMNRKSGVIA